MESQRIADLEIALGEAIAYLKKLPNVPATYHIIRRLGEQLNSGFESRVYQGVFYGGLGDVHAELLGRELILKTTTPIVAASQLHRYLTEGITVELK
jgi:hypothetical protein